MLNSTSPSQHGVAQFCVPAVLYVAQNEWVTDGKGLVFKSIVLLYICLTFVYLFVFY